MAKFKTDTAYFFEYSCVVLSVDNKLFDGFCMVNSLILLGSKVSCSYYTNS